MLLPDGRVLSAGDDYWGMDDTPHRGYAEDQDHAEIYEPAYLFDGDTRAPRPEVTHGPAAVRWGDAFEYDWVITMDCDEQHEPAAIPDFIRAAARGYSAAMAEWASAATAATSATNAFLSSSLNAITTSWHYR